MEVTSRRAGKRTRYLVVILVGFGAACSGSSGPADAGGVGGSGGGGNAGAGGGGDLDSGAPRDVVPPADAPSGDSPGGSDAAADSGGSDVGSPEGSASCMTSAETAPVVIWRINLYSTGCTLPGVGDYGTFVTVKNLTGSAVDVSKMALWAKGTPSYLAPLGMLAAGKESPPFCVDARDHALGLFDGCITLSKASCWVDWVQWSTTPIPPSTPPMGSKEAVAAGMWPATDAFFDEYTCAKMMPSGYPGALGTCNGPDGYKCCKGTACM